MKNLKAKLRKNGGFTLIEMLIVVAIIAILIAIAIPMVSSSLDEAKKSADNANERAALGLAMVQVMTKNKLGTQAVGTTAVTANYKVENGKGDLVNETAKAGEAGYDYGKASGHVDGYITVTYTPGTGGAEGTFSTTWTPKS